MKRFTLLLSLVFITSLGYSQIIINEVLYDPSNSGLDGDANGDGTYDQEDDSFIEFVNTGTTNFDMSGWEIWDDTVSTDGTLRFVFPAGTFVPPNGAIVVFGSGPLVGTFGGAVMLSADTTSSHLNLNNSGEVIGIKDASGTWVLFFDSDALSNNPNESYTRFPDLTGGFLQHGDTTSVLFSPGTQTDGTPFSTDFVVESVAVSATGGATTITTPGGTLQMMADVLPSFATDPSVTWSTGDQNIATVDANGLVTAVSNGNVMIMAISNDGTMISDAVEITVSNQSIGLTEEVLPGINVFPNPASEVLNIDSGDNKLNEISVYSVNGALIETYDGNTDRINVSEYVPGMYLIILTSDKASKTMRFQKTR